MTNEATLEKMKKLRFLGMVKAYHSILNSNFSSMTADELLAHLIDAEWDERYNRKIALLISLAKFRYKADIASINYEHTRNLDKNMVMRLASCSWIEKSQNIIITGSTGTGKSFIACALGQNACLNTHSTLYFNTTKLFSSLKLAKANGSYFKEINKIKKTRLLILDDFGLDLFDKQSALSLMEIIEDRHGEKSTIISSQIPVELWFEIIGDPTIADAVCDRIIHSAYRIKLTGESIRKKTAKKLD